MQRLDWRKATQSVKDYVDLQISESSGATTASELDFVPTGTIAATNTQAAIEELDSNKLSVSITSPTVGNVAIFNGSEWVNGSITTSAGAGIQWFFTNTSSGISGYELLSKTPDNTSEQVENITVTTGTSPVFLDHSYIGDMTFGSTTVDAGLWSFNFYARCDATNGTNTITVHVYKRSEGGTETLLFSESTNGSIVGSVTEFYTIHSVQPAFSCSETDKPVVKISVSTDRSSSTVISFVHSGTTHYSNIQTPLAIPHNNLLGTQGGIEGEKYHLSSAQHAIATQAASASLAGYLSSAMFAEFDAKQSTSLKNTANGYLGLDANKGALINANSSTTAFEIRQLGTGNALTIEDESNLDSSPFVVSNDGSVAIGATSADFFGYNFIVTKKITGNTVAFSIGSLPTIQSDVTAAAYLYNSSPNTQAASFTLAALHHYRAGQGTIGAGSAVINQYGFLASGSLIGATNNYGFTGAIGVGNGRYNFYASGTADNFMAGRLQVGQTDRTYNYGTINELNGLALDVSSVGVITDGVTAASGTVTHSTVVSFDNPVITASNTNVTHSKASTVYIDGAPTAGANVTFTNAYALYINNGTAYFGGNVNIIGGTANTLISLNANKTITSLATTTYPNLTEISYVKGVTSAIQLQLDGKQSTGSYITASSNDTLTNKRITNRVGSTTSSATPTINTDNVDVYKLTAQSVDITSFTTNLSGTPTDWQMLIISITGTAARAITWGASFESSMITLPTTTVTTTTLDVTLRWNADTSKWRCVGVA